MVKEALDAGRVFVIQNFSLEGRVCGADSTERHAAYEPGTTGNLDRHPSRIETGPICG